MFETNIFLKWQSNLYLPFSGLVIQQEWLSAVALLVFLTAIALRMGVSRGHLVRFISYEE